MHKRILILYTSIGLGHKYIALNMDHHLERAGYQVRLYDVLELQKGIMVNIGEWFHSLVNRRFPFVWRWLYLSKSFAALTLPFRVPLASRNYHKVKHVIDEFDPHLVISTQTTASAIMSYLKQRGLYQGKFAIAFSDYHLHRYWLYDAADMYLANIPEQAAEMKQLGVKQPIEICGITLPALLPLEPSEVKQKLQLPTDKKIILMSSGSLGIGFPPALLQRFIRQLISVNHDVHMVMVCGKNEALKQELVNAALPATTVLGFYQPMSDLYQVTDLFLTKPGGLTTAEALQAGVPMQITHWLPGQEELNYNYLTKQGLVYPVPDQLSTKSLIDTVQTRLSLPKQEPGGAAAVITQKNHEGKVLLKAIEKLFHGAFDEGGAIS